MNQSTSSRPTTGQISSNDSTVVPTYRHLLSSSTLNPLNPLRVIALCDVDAAYAQFEMSRLRLPKDKPVAVQQWQGLIAVNYPARKFDISRHETVSEAKKKCPDLIAVHVATYKDGQDQAGYWEDALPETHKVSLEPYRRESVKILKIFNRYCPTIEKASIDEAYLDFSQPVREILVDRYPQLAAVPPDSSLGLDTPLPPAPTPNYDGLGHLLPLASSSEHQSEHGEPDLQVSESPLASGAAASWADTAVSIGAELMLKCRDAVKDELGYTCSAGIAPNKTLAKLCAGLNKPDAQTVLRPEAIIPFLRHLPFQKIRMLGGKLGRDIAEAFDASLVGELWKVPLTELQSKFGAESGLWAHGILRGIDHGEVSRKTDVKSMLSSKNFKPPIASWEEASHWLRIISTELVSRLNEARDLMPGIWLSAFAKWPPVVGLVQPKTICLHFRSETYVSKARQGAFPFTSNLTIEYILRHAEKLLKEFAEEKDRAGASFGKCTNLSIQFQSLERLERGQKGIEAFLGAPAANPSDASSSSNAAKTAVGSTNGAAQKRSSTTPAPLNEADERAKKKQRKEARRQAAREAEAATPKVSFICGKCGSKVTGAVQDHNATDEDDSARAALARLKQIHDDEHVAREVLKGSRVVIGGSSTSKSNKRPKTNSTTSAGSQSRKGAGSSTSNSTRSNSASSAPSGTIRDFFQRRD